MISYLVILTLMTHVNFCCGLLLRNLGVGLMLQVVQCNWNSNWLLSVQKWQKTLNADWSLVVCLLFAL